MHNFQRSVLSASHPLARAAMRGMVHTLIGILAASAVEAVEGVRLFTAPRDEPVRRVDPVPGSATGNGVTTFVGVARPGEFFVFQVGLRADVEVHNLDVAVTQLTTSPGGVSVDAIGCISLDGIGSDGRRFRKDIDLPAGKTQILWFGIDVPPGAGGECRGSAALSGYTDDRERVDLGRVDMVLTIQGDPVTDHGDSIAQNLSRLRWLDSMVGSERTVTAPYIPVAFAERSIRVLGREVELGENGLPAKITSYYNPSNTRIVEHGTQVLADPFAFVVEQDDGRIDWDAEFQMVTGDDLEAEWAAALSSERLNATVTGRLDYTGSGEIRMTLRALHDVDVKDIRLEIPWRAEAAHYFMGLNRRGGKRPVERVAWEWDITRRQDCLWMGDINAGLMLRFKGDNFVRPLVNIYYAFHPLRLPEGWDNGGNGTVTVGPATDGSVPVRASSGPRNLNAGETLTFTTEFYLTPFRPLDTGKQWRERFIHPHASRDPSVIESAIDRMDPIKGPNVLNIHHANYAHPFINYPYSDENFPALKQLVEKGHEKGVKVRVYYTTREITQNMPELFALHAMNGEVIFPGPGRDARTLIHRNGPHQWLIDNLGEDFIPAWVDHLGRPNAEWDLSVITRPDSRWNNFYLEGLKWMVDTLDLDGVYIDDTALDARSLQRARRILDTRPGRLIDLHSWNHFNRHAGYANNLTIYMELLPYIDRLWLGEGFNANNAAWDFWLVEMSGLPFGLMSEMLDGANPWRGMVYGETARLPWSGNPRPIWDVMDAFGIHDAEFIPFFDPAVPVRTGRDDVHATVYRREGRSLVSIGSWAADSCEISPDIDWAALGLDPAKAMLYAPPIPGFQMESGWKPGEAIHVEPKRGWLLILDTTRRTMVKPTDVAADLVEVFREGFSAPDLSEGWRVVKTSQAEATVAPSAGALRIKAPANRHAGVERDLPGNVRGVEVELDPGTDRGQSWGSGVMLVWPNGKTANIHLRMEDKKYGVYGGDGLAITGGPISSGRPETVRILLTDDQVFFHVKRGDHWRMVASRSRKGIEGDPTMVRLGKTEEGGRWQDHRGPQGAVGESAYRNVRVLAE